MKRSRVYRRPDRWNQNPERGTQHAAKRAKERAGVTLDHVLVRDVQDQVADGSAILLEEQQGDRCVYLVKLGNARHPVVFNTRTKHIVTVLPGSYPLEGS